MCVDSPRTLAFFANGDPHTVYKRIVLSRHGTLVYILISIFA